MVLSFEGDLNMRLSISKDVKQPDESALEDVKRELPHQGLRFVSSERESVDNPTSKIMTLRNDRDEEIVIRFSLDGSWAGHKAAIKQALMNHPLIIS